MKKSFMTRALAMGLSLAMAFSLSAATNVSVASAAAKPAMKSTKMTLKVGQSKNYQATAATQKAYKISGIKLSAAGKTKVDAKINSSKKSIKVTGKAATKSTNVVITFKNNKTKKSTKVTTKAVVKANVEEATKIASVKQDTFTQFTVTMNKALETVSTADFSMVRDNDNQVITVRSAALDSADKTKVKLVVYTSLTDAKTYTVTYTAADEAKTQSTAKVTVTDGTVADVAITPLEVTANQETLVEYQTLDANGVIVSQNPVTKVESKVDVTCNTLLGTLDNNTSKLILYNVGDTATFTVTYHTYQYDSTTGAELNVIKKDFTVTGVKDANVISQYAYTVATAQPYDWSKITPVTTVALEDADRYAFFTIKDQKGNDVTATCGYTVESSDNSKVVADGAVADGIALRPVSTGSAYLMVKDTDGKVVTTLPITIGEKRKLSVFKLNTNSVTIATDAAVDTVATGYAEATAKDQYGADITLSSLSSEPITANTGVTVDPNGTTIKVYSSGAQANRTGTYRITATDGSGNTMSTTLNVRTVAPTGTDTYTVAFLKGTKVVTSIDTTVSEAKDDKTATSAAIKAVLVKKNNGVIVDKIANTVTCTAITVTGTKKLFDAVSGKAATVTSAAISNGAQDAYTNATMAADALAIQVTSVSDAAVTSPTNPLVKNVAPGSYTVRYTINVNGKVYYPYATLTVTDKQTAVTANILNTNAGAKTFREFITDSANAKFCYGDVQLKDGEYSYQKADYTINNNGKNAFVKSVTLNVKAAASGNYFQVSVPVNKTFTHDNNWVAGDFS